MMAGTERSNNKAVIGVSKPPKVGPVLALPFGSRLNGEGAQFSGEGRG
jgi:hypothetical protein